MHPSPSDRFYASGINAFRDSLTGCLNTQALFSDALARLVMNGIDSAALVLDTAQTRCMGHRAVLAFQLGGIRQLNRAGLLRRLLPDSVQRY